MPKAAGPRSAAWLRIHVDGAARGNPGPAGAGAVLAGGRKKEELSVPLGETTNNVAEYCALVLALQRAARMGVERVEVFTDSELMTKQVTGEYRVKDKQLQVLHLLVGDLRKGFKEFSISHVPREQNRAADRLANRAVSEWLKKNPPAGRRPAPPGPVQPGQLSLF